MVPEDDERRRYIHTLLYLLNCHQTYKFEEYLRKHFEKSFTFRKFSVKRVDDGQGDIFHFLPPVMDIRGLDNFVALVQTISTCVPDIIYSVDNLVIKNRLDSGQLVGDITIEGTPTLHMLLRNALRSSFKFTKGSENAKKRGKNSKRDPIVEINLSDISNSIEKIDINDSEDPPCDFASGQLLELKNIFQVKGYGQIIVFLNRKNQPYLIEITMRKVVRVGDSYLKSNRT